MICDSTTFQPIISKCVLRKWDGHIAPTDILRGADAEAPRFDKHHKTPRAADTHSRSAALLSSCVTYSYWLCNSVFSL